MAQPGGAGGGGESGLFVCGERMRKRRAFACVWRRLGVGAERVVRDQVGAAFVEIAVDIVALEEDRCRGGEDDEEDEERNVARVEAAQLDRGLAYTCLHRVMQCALLRI